MRPRLNIYSAITLICALICYSCLINVFSFPFLTTPAHPQYSSQSDAFKICQVTALLCSESQIIPQVFRWPTRPQTVSLITSHYISDLISCHIVLLSECFSAKSIRWWSKHLHIPGTKTKNSCFPEAYLLKRVQEGIGKHNK